MRFTQMLLMFSVLITLVCSFPTGSEQRNITDFAQNVTDSYDAQEDKRPLTGIVEDKNPKSGSVVLEFVYKSNGGNSIFESKGTEKDKYIVNTSSQKDTQNSNQKVSRNMTEQKKVNILQLESNPRVNDFEMKPLKSLQPEEGSHLFEKWPKFIYDFLNPIKPFPELHFDKTMKINVQNENTDAYLPYYREERKEPISVAGPPLRPFSIYEREFNVPIFD